MAYLNLSNSLRYDMNGRKRRKKKIKGEVFAKPTTRTFKPLQPDKSYRRDADHKTKYPSMMERMIAEGTFNDAGAGIGSKKEPMKYTGTLIKGIATMHKSNAVPVIDDQHAKDIARMRR
jgi:hypothetical protein